MFSHFWAPLAAQRRLLTWASVCTDDTNSCQLRGAPWKGEARIQALHGPPDCCVVVGFGFYGFIVPIDRSTNMSLLRYVSMILLGAKGNKSRLGSRVCQVRRQPVTNRRRPSCGRRMVEGEACQVSRTHFLLLSFSGV